VKVLEDLLKQLRADEEALKVLVERATRIAEIETQKLL
jgi:hypothetical protein